MNPIWRFYITDIRDGCIRGTDDEFTANSYAECEDYFVVDTHSGEWILSDGSRRMVSQIPAVEVDE